MVVRQQLQGTTTMKTIKELSQNKKEMPPELIDFFNELQEGSRKNIEDMKKQIADAEQELIRRRNLGENI